MEKGRDVRRGNSGSGFSTAKRHIINKQSVCEGQKLKLSPGLNGVRGDLQFPEKSKKEKVRSLSAVGKALSTNQQNQMGFHLSQKSDGSPSSAVPATKRFKLPRKRQFLNECNGVDHASVPRKIRSAMKKRGRESISTDSEKVSHKINGIESPEKDGIKKSKKQGNPDWSTRQAVSGPITKDEEEVVETLYALAGMFPDNCSNAKRELDCESLPENSTVLQDPEESANATFEALGTTQNASPCPERSPRGAANSSLEETIGKEQTDFPESAKFLVESHSIAPKKNVQAMPMMVRSENGSKDALYGSDLCLAMGFNLSRQSHISQIERKPDVEFETVRGIDCQQEQHMSMDQKENGGIDWKQEQHMIKNQKESESSALWPGLSSKESAGINASYLQSSAAKAPDWLNAAIYASKQDFTERSSSGGKISKVIHKKSWRRCTAHVHISHLIRSLEVSVTKEPELYECRQTSAHQGSKYGVLMEAHDMNGMRVGFSSVGGTVHPATVRNSHETKNDIQQQCHYHDISLSPLTPGVYGPQKQSFNFLSLSAGANGLKVNDNFNKVGSRSEPSSKLQVPYFQSLGQQHGLMPIPTTQSQYGSTSYLDHLPVAGPQVRLQPHYYGSPLCGSHYSSTVSNKQQDQSFWAMQLAAQGRSAVNCNSVRAQYPVWQGGRHDSSAASPYAQVILPRSSASLEALGSKITSISEQQLFALASSLPKSRTNGLDIHLPSVCEESRGQFRSSGNPSLQLLCDERI